MPANISFAHDFFQGSSSCVSSLGSHGLILVLHKSHGTLHFWIMQRNFQSLHIVSVLTRNGADDLKFRS